jgi:hypothetical protein
MNNPPSITDFEITYPNETITELLRSSEHINVKANVSDVEQSVSNVDLRLLLYGPGDIVIDRSSVFVRTNPEWHFDGNFTLPTTAPIGEYTGQIIVNETINNIEYNSSKTFDFSLKNNIPNATRIKYTINDQVPTASGIRIKEFGDITFNITVDDVDVEDVDIIQIQLVPDIGEEILFSFKNDDDNLIYTISARDLEYGSWVAWIWVIDTDEVRILCDTPYPFDIIPDQFPKILPWIMLLAGAIVAFGVSMAFLGTRYITLRRDFDNLLSRTGDYKKVEEKPKKMAKKEPKMKNEGIKTETTTTKKKSSTKKHKLFREIKKK